jgi:hypothetical protein
MGLSQSPPSVWTTAGSDVWGAGRNATLMPRRRDFGFWHKALLVSFACFSSPLM